MAKQAKVVTPLNIGDRVRIRNYAGKYGRIVEYRGALGPGGAPIFRVLVQRKPSISYIELRGDQLERAPSFGKIRRVKRHKAVPKGQEPTNSA
jgi:hypothetical protein